VTNKKAKVEGREEKRESIGFGRYLLQQMVDQLKGNFSVIEKQETTSAVVQIPLEGVRYGKRNKASSH